MLKVSKKSRVDIDSARKSVLIISHNTFRYCRVQIAVYRVFESVTRRLWRQGTFSVFQATRFPLGALSCFIRERLTCLFILCKKLFTSSFFRSSSCVWQGTVNCTTTVSKGLWDGLQGPIGFVGHYSPNAMKWVKLPLLTSKYCLFSSNIPLNYWLVQRTPPLQRASTRRISRENALNTDNSLTCPIEIWRCGEVVYETTLCAGGHGSTVPQGFARCCDKRISSLTLKRTNLLRVERLQRRINTQFCSNSVQSIHSGCLPFSVIQWCECYARCDWSLPMIY